MNKSKKEVSTINHICHKCGGFIKSSINKHINYCDGRGTRRQKQLLNNKKSVWNKGLTKNTNSILKKISEDFIEKYKDSKKIHKHTNETKRILSEKMNERYSTGWESTAGRCQKIKYNSEIAGEVLLDGYWELEVTKYLDSINVIWERNKKRFSYFNTIKNKNSSYCPDFFIKDWNAYLEIKGYETELDKIKWEQFPEVLLVWKKEKLRELGIDIRYKKKKSII
jgi:hypothetical protein